MLRKHGVVDKFVEFCGDGLSSLSVPDRATLSNMCPEYGATSALFPVDQQTLRYLQVTGRDREQIELVERYAKEQGLFRVDGAATPKFSELLELDLSKVESSLAGPKRPQDRVPLRDAWSSFTTVFTPGPRPEPEAISRLTQEGGPINGRATVAVAAKPEATVENGSVVIAAITSCTNTSNPSVMIAAGLLAKKAVELGLTVKPYVKTSLAPGSRVVTDYLQTADLLEPLEKLGFFLVGYGCTTCIGNSGPLASPEIEAAVSKEDLSVVAVLSGNRNFFFFQAEDGIRDLTVTGVQTCALPIYAGCRSGRLHSKHGHTRAPWRIGSRDGRRGGCTRSSRQRSRPHRNGRRRPG